MPLEQLVDAELIYRRAPPIDYEFKHAWSRMRGYNSLLRSKRLQFHKRIGETLEALSETIVEPSRSCSPTTFARQACRPRRFRMRCGRARRRRRATRRPRRGHASRKRSTSRTRCRHRRTPRAQIEAILKLASVAQNRGHYEIDLKNPEQARTLAEDQ